MKYEVSSGLTLAASVYGSPSDNLVILLHGGGQTRHAWGATGQKLSECGFYAVALDLRGHGDSDWSPDGSYKVENFRDDLLSVIRQIGKPAALVGASLGGMISLSTVGDERFREFCNALVLSLIHI